MSSFVTLEICIVTLATSVSWKVCSAMRRINEQEAGRTAYMMNEKNKSLGKPGIKTEGTKKTPLARGGGGKMGLVSCSSALADFWECMQKLRVKICMKNAKVHEKT